MAIFEDIATGLGPHEGLMIDQTNDPRAVSCFFERAGVTNQCFSNGISVVNNASWLFAPHIRPSIAEACDLRASEGKIRFVAIWTVNDVDLMTRYIRLGVDAMIVDKSPPSIITGRGSGG